MAQFEFGPEHDREFTRTAYWMGLVGRLGMIIGSLQFIGGGLRLFHGSQQLALQEIIGGLVYATIGFFTFRVARSFRAIATSTGRDLDHLMLAIGSLRRLFSLVTLGIFALLAIALTVGLLFGALGVAG